MNSIDSKEDLIESELNGSDNDSITRPGPSDYSEWVNKGNDRGYGVSEVVLGVACGIS